MADWEALGHPEYRVRLLAIGAETLAELGRVGEARLWLEVARPGAFRLVAKAEEQLGVAPSDSLTREIEALLGPGTVHYGTQGAR